MTEDAENIGLKNDGPDRVQIRCGALRCGAATHRIAPHRAASRAKKTFTSLALEL